MVDHKLLWRSNLYIQENDDWNDAHPWVEGNEWNRDENGQVVSGEKAGKQVAKISPFTYYMESNNTDYEVTGNVGYFGWGVDAPHEFNGKLNHQKVILGQWYPRQGATYKFMKTVAQWGPKSGLSGKTLEQLYALTFGQSKWSQLLGAAYTNCSTEEKKTRTIEQMNWWIDGNNVL